MPSLLRIQNLPALPQKLHAGRTQHNYDRKTRTTAHKERPNKLTMTILLQGANIARGSNLFVLNGWAPQPQ